MNLSDTYLASLTSQITYVDDLNENSTGLNLKDQIKKDMSISGVSESQAQYFADNFTVVAQDDENVTTTGFQATVFRHNTTREYYFAMRGTDDSTDPTDLTPDWISNIFQNGLDGVAANQVVDLLNFYSRLIHDTTTDVPQFEVETDWFFDPPGGNWVETGKIDTSTNFPRSQYIRLQSTGTEKGLGTDITASTDFIVTGHSLGGHLASVFSLLFPNNTTETFTFNSAGIFGISGNTLPVFSQLVKQAYPDLLIQNVNTVSASNVTDFASPQDPVSRLPGQTHLSGGLTRVEIDTADSFLQVESVHSIDRLVDSLAVMNALYYLDNTITLETANRMLDFSAKKQFELEGVTKALADLFGASAVNSMPTMVDDHNNLYNAINSLVNNPDLENMYSIRLANEQNLVISALGGDISALYTLLQGNPLVIYGNTTQIQQNLYSQSHIDFSLDVNNYSEQYLEDRALMINTALGFNENDDKEFPERIFGRHVRFIDIAAGIDFQAGQRRDDGPLGAFPERAFQQIVFADAADNTLTGYFSGDHLYGGAGKDDITGGIGDDYLEGGLHEDSYYFNYGDGNDTIFDADTTTINTLYIQHTQANAQEELDGTLREITANSNIYQEVDSNGNLVNQDTTYTIQTNADGTHNLLISVDNGTGGNITILNFGDTANNHFGLTFGDPKLPDAPDQTNNVIEIGDGQNVSGIAFWDRNRGPSQTDSIQYDASLYLANSDKDHEDYPGEFPSSQQDSVGNRLRPFWFYGGDGNDVLIGGVLDPNNEHFKEDLLFGGNGDDILRGEPEGATEGFDDELYGQDGNDQIYGLIGNDILGGGLGDDLLVGGDGNNTFNMLTDTNFTEFYSNGDVLLDKDDINTLIGGGGFDWFRGGGGTDTIIDTGSERSVVHAFVGSDHVNTGAGNDFIHGDAVGIRFDLDGDGKTDFRSSNTLFTFSSIYEYDDTIHSQAGDDYVYGSAGTDTIFGGEGSDTIFGDELNDIAGNRIIHEGELVSEEVAANYFRELDIAFHGNDLIEGGEGQDIILGNGGDDTIRGGMDADTLWGDDFVLNENDHGNDTLSGGEGDDFLMGGGGSDLLEGGDGQDVIYGDSLAREFFGVNASSFTLGSAETEHLGKNYTLSVEGSNDILIGGNGDDFLFGDGGNDILVGGDGVDALRGGNGLDDYIFSTGDDFDYVRDDSIGTVTINGNIVGADVISDSEVRILYGDSANPDVIIFQENSIAHVNQFIGTSINNQVSNQNDFIFISSEGGSISSAVGDDFVIGAIGQDFIDGGAGQDFLYGGSGDDELSGGSNSSFDYLVGGDGSDNYLVNQNSNHVIINNYEGENAGTDSVVFGEGINLDDGIFQRSDSHLLISFSGQSQVVQFNDYFTTSSIDRLIFDNGDIFTKDQIDSQFNTQSNGIDYYVGSSIDETITISEGDDHIFAESGNDTINDSAGNDFIDGGRGNDNYHFSTGMGDNIIIDEHGENELYFDEAYDSSEVIFRRINNIDLEISFFSNSDKITVQNYFFYSDVSQFSLHFSNGFVLQNNDILQRVVSDSGGRINGTPNDETLAGGTGRDDIFGRNGNDKLLGGEGSDFLWGGLGDDLIRGDEGNDRLTGEEGDDSYFYAAGDGRDTIVSERSEDAEGYDRLIFSSDITNENTLFERSNYDLLLTFSEFSGEVALDNFFLNIYQKIDYVVDEIRWGNGEVWTWQRLASEFGLNSLEDVFQGSAFSETINGTENNDEIFGADGDDQLNGFGGDDRLHGDDGRDRLFGGVGQDTLFGGDLNDTLNGGSGSDTLFGGEGEDSLRGDDGNDFLYGNKGDDYLEGGDGDDTYFYSPGDGNDRISGSNFSGVGIDRLVFSEEITPESVRFSKDFNDLLISFSQDEETVTVIDFFNDIYVAPHLVIEEIEWGDGQVWNWQRIAQEFGLNSLDDVFLGTAFKDDIWGTEGDDEILGGDEEDILRGRNGEDTLRGGEGDDTLRGGNDNDILYGDAGNDVLNGEQGSDILYGGTGDDRFSGSQDDIFYGGEGNDTFIVSGGHVFGGMGNDVVESSLSSSNFEDSILVGGEGDDTFRVSGFNGKHLLQFSTGDGHDVLSETLRGDSPVVRLEFDESVSADTFLISSEPGENSYEFRVLFEYGNGDTISIRLEDFVRDGIGLNLEFIGNESASLDLETIYQHLIATTDGDDDITFLRGDVVNLMAGDDRFIGSRDIDDITGGEGNDTLLGGSGNDIYRYQLGDGIDHIQDLSGTIQFGDQIDADSVVLSRSGNHLHVDLEDGQIIIENYYQKEDSWSDRSDFDFFFDNGDSGWLNSDVHGRIGLGSDRDDVIELYTVDFFGDAGFEVRGNKGNDVFLGDWAVNQNFYYQRGDGSDRLSLGIYSLNNTFNFEDIRAEEVSWSINNWDLTIQINDESQSSIVIENFFRSSNFSGDQLPARGNVRNKDAGSRAP